MEKSNFDHDSPGTLADYKRLLSTFPTGVCLVVIGEGDAALGVTISSFVPISLSPPIVQVSLKNNSRFLNMLLAESIFCIYILSDRQGDVATFYGSNPAATVMVEVLDNSVSKIYCRFEGYLVKGDHTLVFGEVEDFCSDLAQSLVYYKSRFGCVISI